jgi:hypothetical protein
MLNYPTTSAGRGAQPASGATPVTGWSFTAPATTASIRSGKWMPDPIHDLQMK